MGFFTKILGIRTVSSKSVAAIPRESKKIIEDYLDNGWLVEEISDETGFRTEQISRIKDIYQRKKKEHRRDDAETVIERFDTLTQAKRELEAEKIKLQIADIQMQKERLELERQEMMGEYEPDDEPDDEPEQAQGGSIAETAMLAFLQGLTQKKSEPEPKPKRNLKQYTAQTTLEAAQDTPNDEKIVEPLPEGERLMSDSQLMTLINTIPGKYIQRIKKGKVDKNTAVTLAQSFAKGITQADAERAYQLVMSE